MTMQETILPWAPETPADVKVLREWLGLSASWVAQRLYVNEKTVSRWELGHFAVNLRVVELLVDMRAEADQLQAKLMNKKPRRGIVWLTTYLRDADVPTKGRHGRHPALWHRAVVGRTQAALAAQGVWVKVTYHSSKEDD